MRVSQTLSSSLAQARSALAAQSEDYVELFNHGTMRIGYYAPKKIDTQTPHGQDELYVVASGTGAFNLSGTKVPFEPGTVLFARAGVAHRFEEFSDDFETWVMFYGPEGGEATS